MIVIYPKENTYANFKGHINLREPSSLLEKFTYKFTYKFTCCLTIIEAHFIAYYDSIKLSWKKEHRVNVDIILEAQRYNCTHTNG